MVIDDDDSDHDHDDECVDEENCWWWWQLLLVFRESISDAKEEEKAKVNPGIQAENNTEIKSTQTQE